MAKSRRITGAIPRQRGGVRVEVDKEAIGEFVRKNKPMRDDMFRIANTVKAEIERTASDAEEGPGGTIDGYAAAGFEVVWETRNKIPRVIVVSNAPIKVWLAAHIHTIQRDGIAHMRKAMEVIT